MPDESFKQFKDPIYGYITIKTTLVCDIIDTPAFQRLKDIRQTSYTPLYPAAYHNRYVHSLGVYHLGCIAFQSVKPQLEQNVKYLDDIWDIGQLQEVFELACLLHDIGHAPFSHTGEIFYLDEADTLYTQLKDSIDDESFSLDFDSLGTKKPAPHECMSCIVGIRTFSKYFCAPSVRSFFARCIIGMPISFLKKEPKSVKGERDGRAQFKAEKAQVELLNCVISLLNSSIIDVDRLDYIIRDALTIGFKSVEVDYMRLLKGIRIEYYSNKYSIVYHKSALSIIESAIYAHDAEKKWVQAHPAILYEMETLKSAMRSLTNRFSTEVDSNPIFCFEALTENGKWLIGQEALADDSGCVKTKCPISLLADEDILHLMKVFCKDELGYEYFARNKRRIPIWKSEAEFRAIFQNAIGENSKSIQTLQSDFESLAEYCENKNGTPIVNESIVEYLDAELKENEQALQAGDLDEDLYADVKRSLNSHKYWVTALKDLSVAQGITFEFLIIIQKRFNSSFKASLKDIPIYFPRLMDGVIPLEKVSDVLRTSGEFQSNFFHLFYTPSAPPSDEMKSQIINFAAQELITKAIGKPKF